MKLTCFALSVSAPIKAPCPISQAESIVLAVAGRAIGAIVSQARLGTLEEKKANDSI